MAIYAILTHGITPNIHTDTTGKPLNTVFQFKDREEMDKIYKEYLEDDLNITDCYFLQIGEEGVKKWYFLEISVEEVKNWYGEDFKILDDDTTVCTNEQYQRYHNAIDTHGEEIIQ